MLPFAFFRNVSGPCLMKCTDLASELSSLLLTNACRKYVRNFAESLICLQKWEISLGSQLGKSASILKFKLMKILANFLLFLRQRLCGKILPPFASS